MATARAHTAAAPPAGAVPAGRGLASECLTSITAAAAAALARGALQLVGEPVEALVESIAAGGAGGLDVPAAVPQRVQTQLVGDLGGVHGVGQILAAGGGVRAQARLGTAATNDNVVAIAENNIAHSYLCIEHHVLFTKRYTNRTDKLLYTRYTLTVSD